MFDRHGNPTKVIGVYPQGKKTVFKLTLQDGRTIECGANHLWQVYDGYNAKDSKTVNTTELLNTFNNIRRGHKYYLPMNDPVHYTGKESLYNGYVNGLTYSLEGRIPDEAKTASIDQRWAVVQGMMDLDGYVDEGDSSNNYDLHYFTKSRELKDGLMEILYSLGCSCTCEENDQYDVHIDVPNELKEKFFRRSKEKKAIAEKAKDYVNIKDFSRIAIVNVEKTKESCDQVCFKVDNEEHLFLAGDYIVTHNTLVAVMPSYLNALTGKGVHVVTVNDYLAKRDAETMGKIHEFLGLTVGCVTQSSTPNLRKAAYNCDITYINNTQLGFDWLRDNRAQNPENTVQRGLEFCILDEADSILIDEARTPLILSGMGENISKMCIACDTLAKKMEMGDPVEFNKIDAFMGELQEETGDFIVHEKDKLVTLTEAGVKKIEQTFSVKQYSDPENLLLQHMMDQALRANYIMFRDKDYVVKDDEILIVDEFTGRILPGRQYSDGLHQAIEAKEGVTIKEETKTIASTTYQMLFSKYHKCSGMTGTAYSERKEFKHTYHMNTVVIPTNKPMIRDDKNDVVYGTKKDKNAGVVKLIKEAHEKGQPVLVGTTSVEASEELSKLLSKERISHRVLNAKQDKKEAEIVAEAGRYGAVTIATNMAGRGTDIIPDQEAIEAGGLLVIGTERHESRRIDDQLRGRSGRQGDPGASVFLLSMDDHLLRLHMPDKMRETLQKVTGTFEGQPMDHKILTKSVKRAQENIETDHFGTRKNVLEFDRINDKQRTAVYEKRKEIMESEDSVKYIEAAIDNYAESLFADKEKTADEIIKDVSEVVPVDICEREMKILTSVNRKAMKSVIRKRIKEKYEERLKEAEDVINDFSKFTVLNAIDDAWMEQLGALEYLRQSVGYVGYAQNDPKTIYAIEAYKMYDMMKKQIWKETVRDFFQTTIQKQKTYVIKLADLQHEKIG